MQNISAGDVGGFLPALRELHFDDDTGNFAPQTNLWEEIFREHPEWRKLEPKRIFLALARRVRDHLVSLSAASDIINVILNEASPFERLTSLCIIYNDLPVSLEKLHEVAPSLRHLTCRLPETRDYRKLKVNAFPDIDKMPQLETLDLNLVSFPQSQNLFEQVVAFVQRMPQLRRIYLPMLFPRVVDSQTAQLKYFQLILSTTDSRVNEALLSAVNTCAPNRSTHHQPFTLFDSVKNSRLALQLMAHPSFHPSFLLIPDMKRCALATALRQPSRLGVGDVFLRIAWQEFCGRFGRNGMVHLMDLVVSAGNVGAFHWLIGTFPADTASPAFPSQLLVAHAQRWIVSAIKGDDKNAGEQLASKLLEFCDTFQPIDDPELAAEYIAELCHRSSAALGRMVQKGLANCFPSRRDDPAGHWSFVHHLVSLLSQKCHRDNDAASLVSSRILTNLKDIMGIDLDILGPIKHDKPGITPFMACCAAADEDLGACTHHRYFGFEGNHNQFVKCKKVIVQHDLTLTDDDGNTALHLYFGNSRNKIRARVAAAFALRDPTLQFLHAENSSGQTPMDLFVIHHCLEPEARNAANVPTGTKNNNQIKAPTHLGHSLGNSRSKAGSNNMQPSELSTPFTTLVSRLVADATSAQPTRSIDARDLHEALYVALMLNKHDDTEKSTIIQLLALATRKQSLLPAITARRGSEFRLTAPRPISYLLRGISEMCS
jgi:hypothetical protein